VSAGPPTFNTFDSVPTFSVSVAAGSAKPYFGRSASAGA
jgi:hypothetical protein